MDFFIIKAEFVLL